MGASDEWRLARCRVAGTKAAPGAKFPMAGWRGRAKLRDHRQEAKRGVQMPAVGSKLKVLGLAAAAVLAMSACGGDGAGGEGGTGVNPGGPGDPGSPGNPLPRLEGAWSGATEIGARQGGLRLLVLDDGEYWTLYGDEVGSGFAVGGFVQGSGVSANGKFSSANARDFFGMLPAPSGTLEANYTTQSLLGLATFPDWTMRFSGAPIPAASHDYAAPAALADIVGLWPMRLTDGMPVDLTVQVDGTFSGVDTSIPRVTPRCEFIGIAAPRPAGTNVFDIRVDFGPACTLANQTVTGVGFTYTIAGTAVREFLVAAVNGSRTAGMALYGTR